MSSVLPVHPSGSALRDGPHNVIGSTTSTDPFVAARPVTRVATRLVIGVTILIGALSLVGAVITSSIATGVRRWDESVNASLAVDRSGDFVSLAKWFSAMADTRPILAIMATVTIALALCRQWRAMLLIPVAMLVEISSFLAVNYLVGRPRPNVSKIGPIPGTYSFPSGHVAATFVCWMGTALLLYAFGRMRLAQVVAAAGAAMTVMTCWSRVYLGMHHTIDVVLGAVLGIAALVIAAWSLNMRIEPPAPVHAP